MIKIVIFDMAGTAIYEDNLVYKTIHSTLSDHGYSVTLDTVLLLGAGKEKWGAIRDILTEMAGETPEDSLVDTLHAAFRQNLDEAYAQFPMSVFPSVQQVITALRNEGVLVAFNTGYARSVAENILNKVGFAVGRDIDFLATASDVENSRPAADMILHISQISGIPTTEMVKVGDSAIDIEEGQNGDVRYTVGVTTGAQSRAQIAEAAPDFIIDDMLELLPIVQGAKAN